MGLTIDLESGPHYVIQITLDDEIVTRYKRRFLQAEYGTVALEIAKEFNLQLRKDIHKVALAIQGRI